MFSSGGEELFGLTGAIAALFIYGVDPNILAHSQIVHTDIPFAAAFFISSYYLWRTMEAPTLPSLFFCLRFFGLAANTKYSFYIILPIWACLLALKIFAATPQTLPIGSSKPIYSRWEKWLYTLAF